MARPVNRLAHDAQACRLAVAQPLPATRKQGEQDPPPVNRARSEHFGSDTEGRVHLGPTARRSRHPRLHRPVPRGERLQGRRRGDRPGSLRGLLLRRDDAALFGFALVGRRDETPERGRELLLRRDDTLLFGFEPVERRDETLERGRELLLPRDDTALFGLGLVVLPDETLGR